MDFLVNQYFLGVVAVVSLFYAIYGHFQARKSSEELTKAHKKLGDVEQSITSFEYIRKKAFEQYSLGNYTKSLDMFKKYYLDNDDKSDFHKAINEIFWDQTYKIYGKWLGQSTNTSTLLGTIISAGVHDEAEGEYPELLFQLIQLYTSRNHGPLFYYLIPMDITAKNYEKAVSITQNNSAFSNPSMNKSFNELVKAFCLVKLESRATTKK